LPRLDRRILENDAAVRPAGPVPVESSRSERAARPRSASEGREAGQSPSRRILARHSSLRRDAPLRVFPSAVKLSGSCGATSSASPYRQTAKTQRRKPVRRARGQLRGRRIDHPPMTMWRPASVPQLAHLAPAPARPPPFAPDLLRRAAGSPSARRLTLRPCLAQNHGGDSWVGDGLFTRWRAFAAPWALPTCPSNTRAHRVGPLRALKTGRQYTPVLSRTTCVAPGASSQSRRVQQLGGSRPEGPHVLSPVPFAPRTRTQTATVPLVDMHPAHPTRTHSIATPPQKSGSRARRSLHVAWVAGPWRSISPVRPGANHCSPVMRLRTSGKDNHS